MCDEQQETNRGIRQYTCIDTEDREKIALLMDRRHEVGKDWQRAIGGEIFAVPVVSKLVSLCQQVLRVPEQP